MSSRLLVGLIFLVSLFAVAPAQAAPGALNVLVTGNQSSTVAELALAIAAEPGVASATGFETDIGTPAAESLPQYDLIVSIGDSSYFDPALWGNQLADYVDAGGAVLQAAYDNWDDPGDPIPTGRFESGGYAPLLPGDNQNDDVTLGAILVPAHPLVQGLPAFPTGDNTTTPLAPGATLLATWSDGRNAIAFKNRVAAVSASPGDSDSIPGIARLAKNTGDFLGRRNVAVSKTGTGTGTVTGNVNGVACGESCVGLFPFGSQFAFKATPAANSYFAGWTGACTGTGDCAPLVAGSDLAIGAIFNQAIFEKKTRVTLSLFSSKVSNDRRVKVRVRNTNNFTVKGTLSARTASKVRISKLRYVKLKSKKFTIKANSSRTVLLKLPKSLEKMMKRRGKLKLQLSAKVKAPVGKTRTVKRRVTVRVKK